MAPELRGQATFLPDDPPRRGVLAVVEPFARTPVDLVVGTAEGPRRQPVNVTTYALDQALPRLFADSSSADATTAFWRATATWALTLVARGRITPTVTDAGYDAWRLGPL